jgi:hypothetical protein
MAKFAALLMTIAFGYAMVTYYSTPIPGFGVSFTHLITDQAQNLARQLEASQAQEIDTRLTELYLTMEQPSLLNTLDLIRYYLIVFVLTGARAALLAVISFGWVATGVAVLVGPIFVPFFIVPQLDWLGAGSRRSSAPSTRCGPGVRVRLRHLCCFLDPTTPFTVDMLTVAGLQFASCCWRSSTACQGAVARESLHRARRERAAADHQPRRNAMSTIQILRRGTNTARRGGASSTGRRCARPLPAVALVCLALVAIGLLVLNVRAQALRAEAAGSD